MVGRFVSPSTLKAAMALAAGSTFAESAGATKSMPCGSISKTCQSVERKLMGRDHRHLQCYTFCRLTSRRRRPLSPTRVVQAIFLAVRHGRIRHFARARVRLEPTSCLGQLVLLSPPCGTFSRARFNYAGANGPRPLRTRARPRGFPWLRNADLSSVQLANYFVDQSLKLAETQAELGGFFLIEHPEQLGRVKSGDVPGSTRDFESMRSLVERFSAATWAVHQCFFGADSAKPTRLASNLPQALQYGQCWHQLDANSVYQGPLLQCPHDHKTALIGRADRAWRAAATAYPSDFCLYLANLILSVTNFHQQQQALLSMVSHFPSSPVREGALQESVQSEVCTSSRPGESGAAPPKASGATEVTANSCIRSRPFARPRRSEGPQAQRVPTPCRP